MTITPHRQASPWSILLPCEGCSQWLLTAFLCSIECHGTRNSELLTTDHRPSKRDKDIWTRD